MARGFTLLEMLVVLLILGLVAGLVLSRGPPRSATLDLRQSAGEVAQALRLGRARAIATDRPQIFVLDLAGHRYRLDGEAAHALPPQLALSISNVAGIIFLPDGSSSGGRVELAEGARRVQIGVDWLTGRVSVADGR